MGWWEISGSWWVVVQSLNTRYIVLDRSRRRLQVVVCCGVRFVGEWGRGFSGCGPRLDGGGVGAIYVLVCCPLRDGRFKKRGEGGKYYENTLFLSSNRSPS